jgi:hypothetical protein
MFKLGGVTVWAVLIALSSCSKPTPYENKSDSELEATASSLDLPQRYDLYYEVYYSSTPRRPILAPKVAEFKEQALSLAVTRASDSGREVLAALAVIRSVSIIHGVSCTPAQEKTLLAVATHEALGATIQRQIVESCSAEANR